MTIGYDAIMRKAHEHVYILPYGKDTIELGGVLMYANASYNRDVREQEAQEYKDRQFYAISDKAYGSIKAILIPAAHNTEDSRKAFAYKNGYTSIGYYLSNWYAYK